MPSIIDIIPRINPKTRAQFRILSKQTPTIRSNAEKIAGTPPKIYV
ncbi:MAG: hypothetical protein KIH10_06480 [Candidatus Freyarchaeota archaeon]|nr:hypothetical protein [Candidatus Jordarchaeia archaeon]MBS7280395.1 hypothetical protein [Candidatus Jordarchaeia archaeon]